jgi:hypothetical protein
MYDGLWRRARRRPGAERCRLTRRERRALRGIVRRLRAEDALLAGLFGVGDRARGATAWVGALLFALAVLLDQGLLMLASVVVVGVPVGRWFVAWAGTDDHDGGR